MMFTQSLMGGKALTHQKGASKPGEQPVRKLIMRFHSEIQEKKVLDSYGSGGGGRESV